jgi:hypothetical protein
MLEIVAASGVERSFAQLIDEAEMACESQVSGIHCPRYALTVSSS